MSTILTLFLCLQTLEVEARVGVYIIEAITDHRKGSGDEHSVEYRVAWRGYKDQDTWEPYANIKGRGDRAIQDYLQKTNPAGRASRGSRKTS